MTAKKRKFWNIPPEEEQTGLLLWFQILQKHYLKLFGANAIAVLSLLPCAYFIYLLIQTGDVVFWVVGWHFLCWRLPARPDCTVSACGWSTECRCG